VKFNAIYMRRSVTVHSQTPAGKSVQREANRGEVRQAGKGRTMVLTEFSRVPLEYVKYAQS